ncbi:hypothetical protein AK88_05621 [Plasmodium fragile]|uniref:Uncharacterized protein n=1 Tax=Plasmodium fragile TaxID=5857 RepID=A0A0D9QD48_PLAFR|nr:uncharacterized protein AK88_05621 [Plasmodium fragile]KJP84747.1 hypothetical protein AK88_05621 [Plasmodium fragile]
MKKYTASKSTKMLFLCCELLLFICFICVLQNVNHGIHYNPRTCPQNDKSRNNLINSRQLALLHGPGFHDHCSETIVETPRSTNPNSINTYVRNEGGHDWPFDRTRLNRIHHHTDSYYSPFTSSSYTNCFTSAPGSTGCTDSTARADRTGSIGCTDSTGSIGCTDSTGSTDSTSCTGSTDSTSCTGSTGSTRSTGSTDRTSRADSRDSS